MTSMPWLLWKMLYRKQEWLYCSRNVLKILISLLWNRYLRAGLLDHNKFHFNDIWRITAPFPLLNAWFWFSPAVWETSGSSNIMPMLDFCLFSQCMSELYMHIQKQASKQTFPLYCVQKHLLLYCVQKGSKNYEILKLNYELLKSETI